MAIFKSLRRGWTAVVRGGMIVTAEDGAIGANGSPLAKGEGAPHSALARSGGGGGGREWGRRWTRWGARRVASAWRCLDRSSQIGGGGPCGAIRRTLSWAALFAVGRWPMDRVVCSSAGGHAATRTAEAKLIGRQRDIQARFPCYSRHPIPSPRITSHVVIICLTQKPSSGLLRRHLHVGTNRDGHRNDAALCDSLMVRTIRVR